MQVSVFCRGRPLATGACLHQSVRCMATSSSSARCMATGSSFSDPAKIKVAFIGAGEHALCAVLLYCRVCWMANLPCRCTFSSGGMCS